MGNESLNKEMKNLQNLMVNLVDENNKIKEKIEEMSQEIKELKESEEF